MYVLEESDCAILPMKLPNKEAKAFAEAAEGRARTNAKSVHTESRWTATPVGHRVAGRQDRPASGGPHPQPDLRGGLRGFSYGFRPGRSPHQALDALHVGISRKRVNWILDADIRGFFDNMSHEWTMKFMAHRIADNRVLRLIQKWLKAGVSEEGEWSETKAGTPQGAVISPLLANVYLHYSSTCGSRCGARK
jgi:hypothetical protein